MYDTQFNSKNNITKRTQNITNLRTSPSAGVRPPRCAPVRARDRPQSAVSRAKDGATRGVLLGYQVPGLLKRVKESVKEKFPKLS